MEYVRQYQNRINWQNEPSLNTPINETNLNKMDNALNYMDEKLSEAIGGGIVEANPSGSATDNLNKIGINGTVYEISGGGGGSYTAGNGINITSNVITNTRKGALTGVIDSVSSNIAHTQITGARDTFVAGALILLQSEAAGTANNLRIQYGAQSSESQTFAIYDTSSTAASVTIASGDTVIMMIDNTGYRAIILNVLSASGGSSYAGLGIGKKTGVTSNVIDTDIDLHRAPIVGDRLLIYFDEKVTNPTGLITYNNGTAVTSNLENVTPLYINAGLNILQYEDSFLATGWVRKQNISIPHTLSGLSDTLIVSPSDGQMLVYDNNMWKNKTALQANPTGTAVRELKKIQIGDNVFDTFGLKTFDVTSVTSGVNGSISVDVITASQLDGEIIAVHTGAYTGSTGNAWTLALSDGQTIEALTMSKGGSAYTDAITANCLLFVKCDISNSTAVVLGIVGGGSDVSANGSGTPASYLNKLKIGSATYDASAIRPFSVSQIANNSVKIYVADIDQLDGKIIALSTGALTGTTSSAWSLNLVDTSGGAVSLDVDMLNADGTAFTDDIGANELLFVSVDLTSYEGTILGVVGKSEDEIKTATGNPLTLTDAVAGNALEVSAEIVASQDLHGLPFPYVGGAYKNKLPLVLTDIKALNTEGTWSGNVYTNRGVTFTVLTNDDNVICIKTNGTPTNGNINFNLCSNFKAVSGETYTISGSPSGVSDSTYRIFPSSQIAFPAGNRLSDDVVADRTRTAAGNENVLFFINIFNGVNVDNKVFYPQIEIGTQATSYVPYTNICPITGYSSVAITNVDAESHTATVTVSLGSTVYGGTLDLTSGELTVSHGEVDLGPLSWVYDSGDRRFNAVLSGIKDVTFRTLPMKCSCYDVIDDGTPFAQLPPYCIYNNGTSISVHDARYTDAALFTTAVTGQTLVYPLATPTTTTLTAAQLALVKGQNTLTCNSGDMSITYKASGLDALKERVDELEDAVADLETDMASKAENSIVGTVESGTTASQAYAVGEHFIRNDKFCTCISAIASGATLTLNTNYVEGTIAENLSRATTYSSSETEIGTWNGQKLYRKVIDCGGMIQGTKYVSSGVSGAITVRHAFATAYSSTYQMPLPFLASGYEWSIGFGFVASTDAEHPNSIRLTCPSDQSTFSSVIAVLEYTKNS